MTSLKTSTQRRARGGVFWFVCLPIVIAVGCLAPSLDSSPETFRVMTYNIRHGEGMDGRIDLARIAEIIRDEAVEVVALQEVDRGVARSGRRDLAGELASLAGMTCVFSNNYSYQGGEYGNALLTRMPVKRWANTHYRMLREGEQRGLLQVEVELAGLRLVVMNTHLDYRPQDAERLSNVAEIEQVAGRYSEGALIVCGDFNAVPGSPTHEAMKRQFEDAWELAGVGEGFTYSSREPQRRIDYIFYGRRSGLVPVKAWVPSSQASDHLPLVVEFRRRSS